MSWNVLNRAEKSDMGWLSFFFFLTEAVTEYGKQNGCKQIQQLQATVQEKDDDSLE